MPVFPKEKTQAQIYTNNCLQQMHKAISKNAYEEKPATNAQSNLLKN